VNQVDDGVGADARPESTDIARQHFRIAAVALLLLSGTLVVFVTYGAAAITQKRVVDPRFTPRHWVNLDEGAGPDGASAGAAAGRLPLRVAIAPVVSPEPSLVLYQAVADYLGDALGRDAAILRRRSYAEVNDLVRHGWCDMALVCTYAFVRGEREFGMEALAVPMIGGKTTCQSFIIVPRSSAAMSLRDLKGKRFASADLLSNPGWLYPVSWLKNVGEDPKRFFSEHIITGSHDRSLEAVRFGYADGAAVDSFVYASMVAHDSSVATQTTVIMKSPPFGMPPVVVHRETKPALKEQLREALLHMHTDPDGQRALVPLGIDRFVRVDDALYNTVRWTADLVESQ